MSKTDKSTRRRLKILIVATFILAPICCLINTNSSYAFRSSYGNGEMGKEPPLNTNNNDIGGTVWPYWVFFRIQKGAEECDEEKEDGKCWKIAGENVKSCAGTDGVYFSFASNRGDSGTVSLPLSTMPYSGYTCEYGNRGPGQCATIYITKTVHLNVHPVSNSVYNDKVFQPEYILYEGQSAPNGIVHETLTDLNKNGNTGPEQWIDDDIPTDALVYIGQKWDENVRTRWFQDNEYYYNPNDKNKTHRTGEKCIGWDGSHSLHNCQIFSYGDVDKYMVKIGQSALTVPGSYYRAGNNGHKRVGNSDKSEGHAELASNVNVKWFCGGETSANFDGRIEPSMNKTEATSVGSETKDGKEYYYYNGNRDDGNYEITFKHTIERTDKGMRPIGQEAEILRITSGGSEEFLTGPLDANKEKDKQKSKTLTENVTKIKSGNKTEVCQQLTYKTKYIDGYPIENGEKTKIACVVILQPDYLKTRSASYVELKKGKSSLGNKLARSDKGENKVTLEIKVASNETEWDAIFKHNLALKIKGRECEVGSKTNKCYEYPIEYYITQTKDGEIDKSFKVGTEKNPEKTTLNSNDIPKSAPNSKSTIKLTAAEGKSTPTICQTIHFRPATIKTTDKMTIPKNENYWQESTVCVFVQRPKHKDAFISATTSVLVNRIENPKEIIYSINNHTIQFRHVLETTKNRKLNTRYTIERLIYTNDEEKDWSKAKIVKINEKPTTVVRAPSKISERSFKIQRETYKGKIVTVCERIKLDPYQYRIDVNGKEEEFDPAEIPGYEYSRERCASVGWPEIQCVDDGTITVFSNSGGDILDKNAIGPKVTTPDTGGEAYLLKGESTVATYKHDLYRVIEKHEGGNQAEVTEGETVDVQYRLADPETTYTNSTIFQNAKPELPEEEIKTNSSVSIKSKTNDALLNANTTAKADTVGKTFTFCQAINYISKTYRLQGAYIELGGEPLNGISGDNLAEMYGTCDPIPNNDVGKSDPAGCVSVFRPYNFNITEIEIENAPSEEPVTGGGEVEINFEINVKKNEDPNNPDGYKITDVPNADIQVIKFVITGKPNDGQLKGQSSSQNSPCDYFNSKLGNLITGGCQVTQSSTGTITPNGITKTQGNKYYDGDGYAPNYAYKDTLSNDVPINHKICFAVGVYPSNSGGNGYGLSKNDFSKTWTVSSASCINVGKRPNLQVWGGSTSSAGNIKTAITATTKDNTKAYFGSWDDYLVISNGTISGMASGAYFISGNKEVSPVCKYAPLTIANANCGNKSLGQADIASTYSLKDKINDYYLRGDPEKYVLLADDEKKTGTIDTKTFQENTSYATIFYSKGNIYIKDNISIGFGRTYSDINIPQIIIYAEGNVYISNEVTRIDAWIIAKGDVKTCAKSNGDNIRLQEEGNPNGAKKCDNRLEITGPVYAKTVSFDRTANGDPYTDGEGKTTIKDPAELINVSPAIYLFGYNESINDAQPKTTYLHKLPPRY